jgi:hypothetical protein
MTGLHLGNRRAAYLGSHSSLLGRILAQLTGQDLSSRRSFR